MLRSLAIQRSDWKDMFVKRELDYVPVGGDRYCMLIIKALASFMGTLAVAIGAVAPLIIKSEHFNATDYGHIVGGIGLVGAVGALTASQLADKFTRIRVLLWGMLIPIVFHFLMAFMPNGQPTLFVVYYAFLGITEAWTIVVVSALLRDFSPRTGRALGVGLVTVGSQSALWLSLFLAGHVLNRLGTWQHMFLLYGFITLGIWLILVAFGREPSKGIRAQIVHSTKDRERIEVRARELERRGIEVAGFWRYLAADPLLWALAIGQGLFLVGYYTFVAYGPLFTVQVFKRTPQDASNLVSYLFASILAGLVLGGIFSDKIRMRKIPGMVFTTLAGIGFIVVGRTVGHHLSNGQIILLYCVLGFVMAMMWSPTNALFSENAEDIAATRQTTAFGVAGLVTAGITQAWIFVAPSTLSSHGWTFVWTFAGVCSIATAGIIAICRGSWGQFPAEVPVTESEDATFATMEAATGLA
jgi:OPA family glycerol-3-phosphate transporter-like MFS transporter